MNNQLKLLYKQAVGKEWAYDFDPEIADKFAKLILRKCTSEIASIITNIDNEEYEDINWAARSAIDMINQHFGIEE